MVGLFEDLIQEVQAVAPETDKGLILEAITRACQRNVMMTQWTVDISSDPIEMERRKQEAFRGASVEVVQKFFDAKRLPSDKTKILYTVWVVKP